MYRVCTLHFKRKLKYFVLALVFFSSGIFYLFGFNGNAVVTPKSEYTHTHKGMHADRTHIDMCTQSYFGLLFRLFVLILYAPVNNFSVLSERVFLGLTTTKPAVRLELATRTSNQCNDPQCNDLHVPTEPLHPVYAIIYMYVKVVLGRLCDRKLSRNSWLVIHASFV